MNAWENISVKIKGVKVTGITYISYPVMPYHDAMIEVKPDHARLIKIGMTTSLSNTGNSSLDCLYEIVHIKDCNIYLKKI